jgi:hypothetical protein
MAERRISFSATWYLAFGMAALWLTACGSSESAGGSKDAGSAGSGGASVGSGGRGSGGSTSAGSGGASVGSGGRGSGGSTSAGSGGASAGSGGRVGSGGSTGTGGAGGSGSGAARSLGYIGCSMSVNVATGYQNAGGMRLWPPIQQYNGQVVQSWTNTSSADWQVFDQQAAMFGKPTAVWVQICIFANPGATYNEVKQLIANSRMHAASGATIYISGQPVYDAGHTCTLAGANGPQLTDDLAKQAGNDATQNVTYLGIWGPLGDSTSSDGCHANAAGLTILGNQAVAYFGK